MAAIKYWVWLSSLYGLGTRAVVRVLESFPSPMEAYFAPFGAFSGLDGLSEQEAALLENKDLGEAERILAECDQKGIRILTRQDADYPARLGQIYDPPAVLYVRGRLPLMEEEPVIALVGTRKASAYGVKMATSLGYQLAAGGGIVTTGLALGADAAAARGVLLAGGKCVGVLGCAIDVDYPPQNASLIADVAATGCVLSEYPPGCPMMNFPRRNRIMSGLASGVCVVEAPRKSGALITAAFALEQGRDLFAVPGNADSPGCEGSNGLLREGAVAVTSGADILSEYAGLFPVRTEAAQRKKPYEPAKTEIDKPKGIAYIDVESRMPDCGEDQKTILRLLTDGEKQADEIVAATGFSAAKTMAELTLLSIRGLVTALPGKRYTLKQK